ncbi:MAG: putative basic amino acid antiporter YfcC [Aliidiomarina sp.]|uniref:putative basic amino acid antiporter YfcC n=1 Tax=Aliidiomarina sp. TaxID=1872439 RepID=UPI0025BDEA6A|nr:putative basic amino acid antiporter YfcC [Aliidiomarina sp.]MCH8500888.1 putative basic amino acid antiporter YfcC [Aliidiomarina sp.]
MTQQANHSRVPDTFVILFFVAMLAVVLNWTIPAGNFSTAIIEQETSQGVQSREVLIPDSYQSAERQPSLPWFAEGGEIGVANIPFEGLVSGTKWGSAIGVMAFILIVGGAFGIIVQTSSVERGILTLIQRTQSYQQIFLILIFTVFSLGGAIFGMGEEAIAFCLVLLPVMTKLGYDKVTVVLVTYVATQIGFATSWMNPFSVAIAQGIADVPLLSGAGYRMLLWFFLTSIGIGFTLCYAARHRSPTPHLSAADTDKMAPEISFTRLDIVILSLFSLGLVWVIWGVVARGYYIPELASQFFVIGIIIGIVAVVGRRFSANTMSQAFVRGAQDLLPAALIVGFAKGIILVLGGNEPTEPSTLNTILHFAGNGLGQLTEPFAAVSMLFFQGTFNFFMTSGSGQAALTMPIMAPLADLVGISRQTAVLAFQLGDGLTNIIVPTSAALIGCLGAVKLDWASWLKAIWKFQLLLAGMATAFVIIAVLIGY